MGITRGRVHRNLRFSLGLFFLCIVGGGVSLLWGCRALGAFTYAWPTPPPEGTIPPQATVMPIAHLAPVATRIPYPSFPPGARLAGVEVGGMSVGQAEEHLRAQLPLFNEPITLSVPLVPTASLVISPATIGLTFALGTLIPEAWSAPPPYSNPAVPIRYRKPALRQQLTAFAERVVMAPRIGVFREGEAITRTFVYTPALFLDVDRAIHQIDQHLSRPDLPRTVPLTLTPDLTVPPPSVGLARILQEAEAMAHEWDGIVGFYLVDLERGDTIGINEQTVFSAASVMKVPILLNAYAKLEQFTEQQREAIRKMIVESDNLAANEVLAATVGGGTEQALDGALAMNELLHEYLGLQHTYQYLPYEGADYFIYLGIPIQSGPPQEGPPPYTEADPMNRTTPAEIGRVFWEIEQCRRGQSTLSTVFTRTLTASRCQEMLDLLAQNGDHTRMRAGIPEHVRVEHKSGWIQDMQSDVGIVRSPGGDFLLALFFYQPTDWLYDETVLPFISGFARMVYSAYNPIPRPSIVPVEGVGMP